VVSAAKAVAPAITGPGEPEAEGDKAFEAAKAAQGSYGEIRDRNHADQGKGMDLLRWYAGSGFEPLNADLRGRSNIMDQDYPDWDKRDTEDYAKQMDSLFDKTKPLDKPITLYRGMSGRMAGKTEWSDPGFISTSSDKRTADTFTKGHDSPGTMTARIHVPAGAKVLVPEMYDGRISGMGEREVMLPRNSHFRVTGKGKDGVTEVAWEPGETAQPAKTAA